MLSFGPEKIVVVLVLAMILLGPDKLPSMARQLGAAWRAFREFQQKMESEVRDSVPDLPSTAEIARFTRSPVAFLNSLAEMDGGEDPVPDPGAATATDDGEWPADPGAPPDTHADGARDPATTTGAPATDLAPLGEGNGHGPAVTPGPAPPVNDPSMN